MPGWTSRHRTAALGAPPPNRDPTSRCSSFVNWAGSEVTNRYRNDDLAELLAVLQPREGISPTFEWELGVDRREGRPALSSSTTAANSEPLPIVEPMIVHWFQKTRTHIRLNHRTGRSTTRHESPTASERSSD